MQHLYSAYRTYRRHSGFRSPAQDKTPLYENNFVVCIISFERLELGISNLMRMLTVASSCLCMMQYLKMRCVQSHVACLNVV